ncbi:hypothetical protein D9M72_317940 [compost metagenome]
MADAVHNHGGRRAGRERPEHCGHSGQRFAEGRPELFPPAYQVGVEANARRVEHGPFQPFGASGEPPFHPDVAHIRPGSRTGRSRLHGVLEGGGSGVAGKVVERPAGEHQQGQGKFDGDCSRGANRSVTAPDAERLYSGPVGHRPDLCGDVPVLVNLMYMR